MLFRKNIPACCAYCANGAKLDKDTVLCRYKSIVSMDDGCRRFAYDPLKRIPEPVVEPQVIELDDLDFSL